MMASVRIAKGNSRQGTAFFAPLKRRRRSALSEVTVEDFLDGRVEGAREVRRVTFKLADKIDALEDVAAAMRDGGDTWEGCHMALVLREHGYVV